MHITCTDSNCITTGIAATHTTATTTITATPIAAPLPPTITPTTLHHTPAASRSVHPSSTTPAHPNTARNPCLLAFGQLSSIIVSSGAIPSPPRTTNEKSISPYCPLGLTGSDMASLVPLLGSPEDISTTVSSIHQLSSSASTTSYAQLVVQKAAEFWICHLARYHVESFWPTVRAQLQHVGAVTDDEHEVMSSGVFSFRQEVDGLVDMVEALALALYNDASHRHQVLDEIVSKSIRLIPGDADKAAKLVSNTHIFGFIFYQILLEKPSHATESSWLSRFAVAHCFYKQSGQYKIYNPGTCSKKVAAIHSVLRIAACTYLFAHTPHHMPDYTKFCMDFMKEISESAQNSRIAGLISFFRNCESRSTFQEPPTEVDLQGNYWYGNHKYEREKIQKFIPSLNDIIVGALDSIILGDEWKDAIDPENELLVDLVPSTGAVQIKMRYPNGQVMQFSQFTSSNKISNDALEENAGTIMAAALVSFQIEGCGAPRGKGLLRMHRHDILFSAGVLHYETVTGKPKATVRSFQRKLSPKSSRLVAIVMNLHEGGENNLLFDIC